MISKALIFLCLCALPGELSAAPMTEQGESRKYTGYVLKSFRVLALDLKFTFCILSLEW